MANRFDSMDPLDRRFVAYGIGGYAARLQGSAPDFGHPGDDTGRVVAGTYRNSGPAEAARVLCAFKLGYDSQRLLDGHTALDDEYFIRTVGLALSIELDKSEIKEVKEALASLPRPLTSELPEK